MGMKELDRLESMFDEAIRAFKQSSGTLPLGRVAFSVPECAEALGVSKDSVWREIYSGRLHSVRLGRRVLIPRKALEELLAESG